MNQPIGTTSITPSITSDHDFLAVLLSLYRCAHKRCQNSTASEQSAIECLLTSLDKALSQACLTFPNVVTQLRKRKLTTRYERLTYSAQFERYDPAGKIQLETEAFLANQLTGPYAGLHHLELVQAIIIDLELHVGDENQPIEACDAVNMVRALHEYLYHWEVPLEPADKPPTEVEAEEKAKGILLLTLRYLHPDWVDVS